MNEKDERTYFAVKQLRWLDVVSYRLPDFSVVNQVFPPEMRDRITAFVRSGGPRDQTQQTQHLKSLWLNILYNVGDFNPDNHPTPMQAKFIRLLSLLAEVAETFDEMTDEEKADPQYEEGIKTISEAMLDIGENIGTVIPTAVMVMDEETPPETAPS